MDKSKSQPFRRALTVLTALVCVGAQVKADHRHDPANGNLPSVSLPGILNGEAAIRGLAEHLPAVALAYGHTPDQLRGLLRSDRTLHVDENGRLLYLDTGVPEAVDGQTGSAAAVAPAAAYALSDTFLLHSRPGAKRVLYLDFDGHVLSGTAWNSTANPSITCPPWDIDGYPGSFSDSERNVIQGIWQRVAEDYRPFDLDVTTEFPGEAAMTRSSTFDDIFGVRVLISPISSYFGSYGGIAYVGVFDYTSDYYKPALVFPEKLGNSEKYIAEAASHEAGHTLGLSHDGTTANVAYYQGHGSGETGWAPIMGVGYYRNLSQWSRGEYSAANNKEDDLVVMQSNGIAYRLDDHGNTAATATLLPGGSVLSAAGVIERNTDVDVFAFATEAGTIAIQVAPSAKGPNLDVLAELFSGNGQWLASANPSASLSSSMNLAVPAGTYYLFVRGTGLGDPLSGYSTYGSLGAYTISGTVIPSSGNQPPMAKLIANPTSGTAPLSVTFDGSTSTDPEDEVITLFGWDFADGTTAHGPTQSHLFSKPGTYPVTLTVQDSGGLAATASVNIYVYNSPPTVTATAAPAQGTAPVTVQFGAVGVDSDGTIVSYLWNFGDGSTASGASVAHTYGTAGNYVARVTVTDNNGGSGSANVSVSVAPDLNKVMSVGGITISTTTVPGGVTATAKVTIVSPGGPVSGATVSGNWSGAVTGAASGITGPDGAVILTSKRYKKAGLVTFTVTNVSKSGSTYNPALNTVTRASK